MEKIKTRIVEENVMPAANGEATVARKRKNDRITIAIASVLTACLLCFAIVLPIVLTRPSDRYCAAGDYAEETLTYNVKEYASRNNKSILYLDWYGSADEVITTLNYNVKDRNDMILLMEYIVKGEDVISISVTDDRTSVDKLTIYESCKTNIVVNNVTVKFNISLQGALSTFEYNGYRYYLQIDNAANQDRITEIVEQMLLTK